MREFTEHLYRFIDTSDRLICFVVNDLFKPLLYANPGCEKCLGYTREELTNKIVTYSLVFQSDREMVLSRFKMRIRGEEPTETYPFRVVTRDGRIRWLNITFSLIRWQGKNAICGIGLDITDSVAREKLLEAIIDVVPYGIGVMDRDMRVRMINSTMARWGGKSPEEVLGVPCHKVFHNSDVPCAGCVVKEAIDKSKPIAQVERVYVGRKRVKYYREGAIPIKDDFGYVMGAVKYMEDITKEVARQRERLREESVRTLIDIAGSFAHDFNNLLAVLMGHLSLVKIYLKGPLKENAEAMEKICLEARELTHQMLYLSSAFWNQTRPVELKDLVFSIISRFEKRAEGIECEVQDDLWTALADVEDIREVFERSLARVLAASGSSLGVRIYNSVDEGGRKYIRIELRSKPLLLQELSISSKGVVRAKVLEDRVVIEIPAFAGWKGKRMLVVSKSPTLLSIMRVILEMGECEVITCESLGNIPPERFDCLIVEMELLEDADEELLKNLKELAERFVVLAKGTTKGVNIQAFSFADAVLKKPFRLEELEEVLES